jgi:hypothetical protein
MTDAPRDLADAFVASRWTPHRSTVEVRLAPDLAADPGEVRELALECARRPSKALGLAEPHLDVVLDPVLGQFEYEIVVKGVTRWAGSRLAVPDRRAPALAGPRGRSGAVPRDHELHAVLAALDETLLADPSALVQTGQEERVVDYLVPGDVVSELLRRRIPLADLDALGAAVGRDPLALGLDAVERLATRLRPCTLELRVGASLHDTLPGGAWGTFCESVESAALPDVCARIGVAFPPLAEPMLADDLGPLEYELLVDGVRRGGGEVDDDPLWGDAQTTIAGHLEGVLVEAAADYADLTLLRKRLGTIEDAYSHSLSIARGLYREEQLARVLRLLAAEGISLADLPRILQLLIDLPAGASEEAAAEHVRSGLRETLSFTHATEWQPADGFGRAEATLGVVTVGEDVVGALRVAPAAAEEAPRLATAGAILRAVRLLDDGAVLIAPRAVRRSLRTLISVQFPHLAVLAPDELDPALRLEPAGELSIAG